MDLHEVHSYHLRRRHRRRHRRAVSAGAVVRQVALTLTLTGLSSAMMLLLGAK
jgi:hypothetical protein